MNAALGDGSQRIRSEHPKPPRDDGVDWNTPDDQGSIKMPSKPQPDDFANP